MSIFALTPSAKRPILSLIEFKLICVMMILFIFLTINAFSLVVRSCCSHSQVAKAGNDRLSFVGSSLYSVDSLRIGLSTLLFTFLSS